MIRDETDNFPERSDRNPNQIPERTVVEAAVREFGPVTFPAYDNANAGVRSVTDEFALDRLLRDPERRQIVEAALRGKLVPAEKQNNNRNDDAPSKFDEAQRWSCRSAGTSRSGSSRYAFRH
jgi:hypothetical protein